MNEKKRRRRTGCLTCRRRRVRCDEGKPTCERCNAANVECAGYEQRRQVESRSSRPPTTSTTTRSTLTPAVPAPTSPTFTIRHADSVSIVYPKFRIDGLPLIALPTNPRPDQRPHARARDILAYQQYLFRTLPLLFPAEHLPFWRDRLCEEAWETEYIFLTIVALGGMHRAVLMMSTPSNNDTSRGLDSKVIAVRTYTEALQRISELSQENKTSDIFVGAFVMLAYFECLFGNIPAAIGHTNEAAHYFRHMQVDGPGLALVSTAIEFALKNLRDTCHVILPLLNLGSMDTLAGWPSVHSSLSIFSPSSTYTNPGTKSSQLQYLLDFVDGHPEVKHLIWDPLAMYERTVPSSMIMTFQEQLKSWTSANNDIFGQFDSQTLTSTQFDCDWQTIDRLPIPPRPYPIVSSSLCLSAAVHSLYLARTNWALSLLDDRHENSGYHLSAYYYIYELMRSIATIIAEGEGVNDKGEGYLACETLGVGLLPMMHILGQCCPAPTWLRWIMEQLRRLGQEGLFNGEVFAKNLNALYTFEMSNHLDSSSILDHFPSPSSRVISVLLPEQDGQSYVAFYASADQDMLQYHPLGHARWSNVRRGGTTKPDIEMYNEQRKLAAPFTRQWVLEQKPCLDWTAWSANIGFSLERALRDHISGSCLENAIYEQGV